MPDNDFFTYLGVPLVTAGYLVWWTTTRLTDEITRNTRAVSRLALIIARIHGIDQEAEELYRLMGNGDHGS